MRFGKGHIQRRIGEGIPRDAIEVGDIVRVTTKGNVEHEGQLRDVTRDILLIHVKGADLQLPVGQIAAIKREE